MDIEKQKGLFLSILKAKNNRDEKVIIPNDILVENGLNSRTFWGVICPSLKEDGILVSYDDPEVYSNDIFNDFEYKKLSFEKQLLLEDRVGYARTAYRNNTLEVKGSSNYTIEVLDKGIEEIDKKIDELVNKLKKKSYYIFVINIDKLENMSKSTNDSLIEDLVVGPLIYKKDGSIYFKQELLKIRAQLKTLLILFMESHKKILDYSNIKDELIAANKRPTTNFATITKYVSELHKILKKYFKQKVIFNQGKEAYIFDIDRES